MLLRVPAARPAEGPLELRRPDLATLRRRLSGADWLRLTGCQQRLHTALRSYMSLKMEMQLNVSNSSFNNEQCLDAMNRLLKTMEAIQAEQSEMLDQVREQMAAEGALRLPDCSPPPPEQPQLRVLIQPRHRLQVQVSAGAGGQPRPASARIRQAQERGGGGPERPQVAPVPDPGPESPPPDDYRLNIPRDADHRRHAKNCHMAALGLVVSEFAEQLRSRVRHKPRRQAFDMSMDDFIYTTWRKRKAFTAPAAAAKRPRADGRKRRNRRARRGGQSRASSPATEPSSRAQSPATEPSSRAGSPEAEPASRAGSPEAETASRAGSPEAETASRAGSPEAEPASRAGSPEAETASRAGSPEAETASRAGSPEAEPASRAGSPEAETASPVGGPEAESRYRVGSAEPRLGSLGGSAFGGWVSGSAAVARRQRSVSGGTLLAAGAGEAGLREGAAAAASATAAAQAADGVCGSEPGPERPASAGGRRWPQARRAVPHGEPNQENIDERGVEEMDMDDGEGYTKLENEGIQDVACLGKNEENINSVEDRYHHADGLGEETCGGDEYIREYKQEKLLAVIEDIEDKRSVHDEEEGNMRDEEEKRGGQIIDYLHQEKMIIEDDAKIGEDDGKKVWDVEMKGEGGNAGETTENKEITEDREGREECKVDKGISEKSKTWRDESLNNSEENTANGMKNMLEPWRGSYDSTQVAGDQPTEKVAIAKGLEDEESEEDMNDGENNDQEAERGMEDATERRHEQRCIDDRERQAKETKGRTNLSEVQKPEREIDEKRNILFIGNEQQGSQGAFVWEVDELD